MTKPNSNNLNIVRFDDKLVYHASYNLTPRAFKVLCYIIARYIKPDEDTALPTEIIVPAIDLIRNAIQGNSHSVYEELPKTCKELMSHIEFSTGMEVDGYKLQGYVAWCSSVVPIKSPNGSIDIRFRFDPLMAQFLLGLTRYVRLYRPEINRLKRSHAIRIFQMLKGIRNRRAKYEVVSREKYEIGHLKFLLKLIENDKSSKRKEKYPKFKDFRRWVITPCIEEINEKTTIKVLEANPIREGRKIKYIEFVFIDQQPAKRLPQLPLWGEKYAPSNEELESLTWAQSNAYDDLIAFGIEEGIAFKQILPTIKGSELKGFEDYFIEQTLKFFKEKAKQYNAGTFVKWWTDKKVFDSSGDVWGKLLETVIARKKALRQENEQAFDNRIMAKDMPKSKFTAWYRTQEETEKTTPKLKKKKG